MEKEYMLEAVKEALFGIENKHGGPFGCVIVKDGTIVGRGHNKVILNNDPTCHGEIEAIRDACKNLNIFDLSGCSLYTTAEPCPMCLGACLWANIKEVFYGCNRKDTEDIGFRDNVFYKMLDKDEDSMPLIEDHKKECKDLFDKYMKIEHSLY